MRQDHDQRSVDRAGSNLIRDADRNRAAGRGCTVAPKAQRLDPEIVIGRHVGIEQLSSSHCVAVSAE
jgi:hypothetical protein